MAADTSPSCTPVSRLQELQEGKSHIFYSDIAGSSFAIAFVQVSGKNCSIKISSIRRLVLCFTLQRSYACYKACQFDYSTNSELVR